MPNERAGNSRPAPRGLVQFYDQDAGAPFGNSSMIPQIRERIRQTAPQPPLIKIGRQWFREVDNGRACVLVPVSDPRFTPAQLADMRRAVQRASFVADNPLAGVADSVAILTGASPEVRDRATQSAGLVNQVLTAVAPLGPSARRPVRPPQPLPATQTERRDSLRYGPLNAGGQATGANATLTPNMIGTGARVERKLEIPNQRDANGNPRDRSHLVAAQSGGTGNSAQQVVALEPSTNRGPVRRVENEVARRQKDGEVIEYFFQPLYGSPTSPPTAVAITAFGSGGPPTGAVISNSARHAR